jgi:hypothetical protein
VAEAAWKEAALPASLPHTLSRIDICMCADCAHEVPSLRTHDSYFHSRVFRINVDDALEWQAAVLHALRHAK